MCTSVCNTLRGCYQLTIDNFKNDIKFRAFTITVIALIIILCVVGSIYI